LACLVLAIASLGNGLAMIFIGAVILARRREVARVTAWLLVSAGCIAAYAYHYNVYSTGNKHSSLFNAFLHPHLLSVFIFLGDAVSVPLNWRVSLAAALLSALVGLVACVFLFRSGRRGFFNREPLIGYCVLFILLTAIGVAGLRSPGGRLEESASRYGMYSAVLISMLWFSIVEEYLLTDRQHRTRLLASAIVIAICFSLTMDVMGWRYLASRNRDLVRGMSAFEHSGAGPVLPFPHQPWWVDELDEHAPSVLKESIRLGIYRPPSL
jgi:peptidoglycan/LPS O-acetylase OafA/YrhL